MLRIFVFALVRSALLGVVKRFACLVCILSSSLTAAAEQSVISAPTATAHRTFALLIGASQYPSLPGRLQLRGPKNDVPAFRNLLLRAGIPGENVTVLADQVLYSPALPTAATIRSHLRQQVEQRVSGETLVLFFAGHGSQQPQKTDHHGYSEPDGLDELFLARDVTKWNGEIGAVENAIIDDELGAAIGALRTKGVNIIAIFDTCHAGDSARKSPSSDAGNTRRERFVGAANLKIPAASNRHLSSVTPSHSTHQRSGVTTPPQYNRRTKTTAIPAPSPQNTQNENAGYLLALYASAPWQTTYETRIHLKPSTSDTLVPSTLVRGMFSYYLEQVLLQNTNINTIDAFDAIRRQYRSKKLTTPNPQFESSDPRVSAQPIFTLLKGHVFP